MKQVFMVLALVIGTSEAWAVEVSGPFPSYSPLPRNGEFYRSGEELVFRFFVRGKVKFYPSWSMGIRIRAG